MQERIINGDLVIEGYEYIFKGNLTVEGTVNIKDGGLVVEGNLIINSIKNEDINIVVSGIYAKNITAKANVYIVNGNICTFKDLNCNNIRCYGGNIIVGGNTHVCSVFCNDYLVDGFNHSDDIKAENAVYIMEFSNSKCIEAPEVFLGGGGDFNGGTITSNHFEFDGHIRNCLRRYLLTRNG